MNPRAQCNSRTVATAGAPSHGSHCWTSQRHPAVRRSGHTLLELIAAMICSAVLLAGLGSVMLIARQVAYTPSAATVRTETSEVVSWLADELQYATLLIGQSPKTLEFVIADRDGDGRAERIRYEWSGTPGDPLVKTVNGGTPKNILEAIDQFQAAYVLKPETTTLNTTTETAETVLFANDDVQSGPERDVTTTRHSAQIINAATLVGVPANAICWNATKVQFQGRDNGSATETLIVQLRSTGGTYEGPTSEVLGQVSIPESALTGLNWKQVAFPSPVRGLALHRKYAVVWTGVGGDAARLLYVDNVSSGVFESNDAGATWQFMPSRELFYRVRGTYTLPGLTHNIVRNYVSHVQLVLQSGDQSHSRVDTSVPLVNFPEQLSSYWRTDFDRDPTTADADGDGTLDWAMAAGGTFDEGTLINGVWHAVGALETRPPNDFAKTTIVEVRCRNTSSSGNGTTVRIAADRQNGLYAPLTVNLKLQPDGITQTLTLLGKTSDANSVALFTCPRLSSDFVTFRLTIVPHLDLVNLHVNDEDQGTYSYPVFAPSTTDRLVTLFPDASLAEFDYADVRVTAN